MFISTNINADIAMFVLKARIYIPKRYIFIGAETATPDLQERNYIINKSLVIG